MSKRSDTLVVCYKIYIKSIFLNIISNSDAMHRILQLTPAFNKGNVPILSYNSVCGKKYFLAL